MTVTSILILPTFIQQLYVCDGEDALLVSIVTLIPVSINLASNSQNITLSGRGRSRVEENRRDGTGKKRRRRGKVELKKEAVKELIGLSTI